MNIIDAAQDENLFKLWIGGDTWRCWHAFLRAVFALPMGRTNLELFRKHTGRATKPREAARECWLIAGRRSGKSLISAVCAVYLSCFKSYQQYLQKGETGVIMVIASDRKQSKIILDYIAGIIEGIPLLARMVEKRTAESITLDNAIRLEVHTASYRSVRGYSIVAAILDELAFFRLEGSAAPDHEIINAIRPGMAAVPGSMLIALSSPYAQRGALWQAYQRHWARDDDPSLVWRASSLDMNPTLDKAVIEQAYREDPVAARSEWEGVFRSDLEALFRREVIESLIIPGRHEVPPQPQTQYFGFCDPSGGSADAMTLAISHSEQDRAVLDCLRIRKPPFDPNSVVAEFAEVLRRYRVYQIEGDHYGGEWPAERFRAHGIQYIPSARSKSAIYLESVARFNGGQIELLDDPRLIAELCLLERRTGRQGKDTVDHPSGSGSHDDAANACCGALLLARERAPIDIGGWVFGESYQYDPAASLAGLGNETEFISLLDF